jgi:molecular chaperone GrpE (heat shock protein)
MNTGAPVLEELLEESLTASLTEISTLKNKLELKELEKHDQFKELALGIIDVIDSFERVESSLIERGMDSSEEGAKIISRYKSISKKLHSLLQKHGVSKLEYPENRLIVGFSKVVDTEPDSERKNDEIVSIVRNGYIKGKELIREAEVIVVKN